MIHHIIEPFGTLTLPASKGMEEIVKIKLNTESLTTLLRSNISCHLNKNMTQEIMEQLTAQIIESINYFINKSDEIL
jgi:hypothetical protein